LTEQIIKRIKTMVINIIKVDKVADVLCNTFRYP